MEFSLLSESLFCRLCGEENTNGTNLFSTEENVQDLSKIINRYLPVQIENNGKYPSKICPGCHIQLEATKLFLDLIIEGQNKLRNLYQAQQDLLQRQEKQKNQLEEALQNVNPSTKVETYTIQSDETGEKFLIQIFSDGPLFPTDHELSLKCKGIDKPRKKRGRPPKPPPDPNKDSQEVSPVEEVGVNKSAIITEEEVDTDGRRKRRIRAPSRYQGVVQGKELDKILKDEGVIDDEAATDNEHADGDSVSNPVDNAMNDNVIGRTENKDGEDLGELIVINSRTKARVRPRILRRRKKYQCSICKKEFLHFGRYNMHKKIHKVFYVCEETECKFQNDDKNVVEEHQKETSHVGILIQEQVDDIGKLELPGEPKPEVTCEGTEETTVIGKKFECQECNKTFKCKQNYEVHCRTVHNQERPYVCSHCNKRFAHSNTLRLHYARHVKDGTIEGVSLRQYNCDQCNKIFLHPSSLLYHRDSQHSNGRRFVCNKCDKSFKHRQLLQRHQIVHSEERPFKCQQCSASFKTRANLVNHQALHEGKRKFWCSQCGQTFNHKTSLTLHQRWHLGQKPYQCDVCKKCFSQKGNLAEHRRIHTGEKPYTCDHCDRAFTTSSQMRLHRKRHTGERPWRCEYCPKSFLHKDTWKCHTRRHLNDRPFKCKECQRAFAESWALKKHERLHTGEKPYKCDRCGKGFADNSNMRKHRRSHEAVFNVKDATVVQIMNSALEEETEDNSLELRQLIDEHGNPINLTTQDGQQVPVVGGDGNTNIQGLLPDGTLIPIDISTMGDEKLLIPELDANRTLILNNEIELFSAEDVEGETHVEQVDSQKLDTNIQFISGDNGVCLVTTYAMDDTESINPQFLTMS